MAGLSVGDVTGAIEVGVENANPPRRGTEEALVEIGGDTAELVTDEKLNVTLREDGAFDATALDSDDPLCAVVAVGLRMLAVDDTAGNVISGATLSEFSLLVCGTSFGSGSILGTFDGSVVIGFAAATVDGTFRRDVVVAVLNVTEVLVLKLADAEETDSIGFSIWPHLSLSLGLTLTLSTSSFGSSPRKALNIIANFDSLS